MLLFEMKNNYTHKFVKTFEQTSAMTLSIELPKKTIKAYVD